VPNDISKILKTANIEKIITNGKKADSLYKKYIEPKFNIKATCLPSTSPANAQWSLDRLCDVWKNELR
jgi:G:T/U-mismatch repair DNA glycosylase